ncbi:hypothetical protein BCE_2109 [Bacillus cereus ATCC 10987]|uniref:Uncharacterized protein n=1 Tax=Bacillus cereus (strain ATCC 10987 / NRS 248) TaxID=222523 RepID=Q739N1_BACC1|nr:hypothetical protein BCE_2109 [Bacillus cereus ATCC 10987]
MKASIIHIIIQKIQIISNIIFVYTKKEADRELYYPLLFLFLLLVIHPLCQMDFEL